MIIKLYNKIDQILNRIKIFNFEIKQKYKPAKISKYAKLSLKIKIKDVSQYITPLKNIQAKYQ